MRIASLRYAAVLAVVSLTSLACADAKDSVAPEPAPLLALVGRDSAVFVLARSDYQTSAPIVSYDRDCTGVRIQHTERDTITIWTDGRARTAWVTTTLNDGLTTNVVSGTATGTWVRNTMPNVYYFSAAPSIVLNLQYTSVSGQIWLRSEGDSAFTRLYPTTSGSCAPGTRTAHESIFTYTRR